MRGVWWSWVLAGALAGCGGSPSDQSCVPGTTRACACPSGVQGAQSCGADGAFGACECGTTFAAGGAGGTGGTAGVGGLSGAGGTAGAPTGGVGGVVGGTGGTGGTTVVDAPADAIAEPSDPAAFLWQGNEVETFDIEVSQADLDSLDASPAAEQYVTATLKFGQESYPNVGLRYKGSVGAFVGCTAGAGPLDPSGPKTCPKLSMKVSMNWMQPGNRFHGLKKLQFHSMNSDDSLLRERLAYALFRQMGIASPRAAHVRLRINGQFAGLFLLVEQIDSRFTRAHFTDGGDGNLYKEIWPRWTEPSAYYPPALRTNEDDLDLSYDRIVRFAQELEAAADPDGTVALVERWMDVEYLMRFIAVDRAILHDDGMFHWYCNLGGLPVGNNPGQCSNHNYYLYEQDGFDRLWLVPWDMDLTFGGDSTGFITINSDWDASNPVCTGTYFGQMPPACDKLTRGWGHMQDRYRAAVAELVAGPFTAANVDGMLAQWQAEIEPVVAEAAAIGHSPSVSGWSNAVTELQGIITQRRQAMQSIVP